MALTLIYMPVKLYIRFLHTFLDLLFVKFILVTFIIDSVLVAKGYVNDGFAINNRLPITFFLYFLLCEFFFGRTLGKLITNTKVVTTSDGVHGSPTFNQILVRSLVRFIPLFDALSFLIFGEGWHDTWSKTAVVKNKPF